jgi:small subunit ribosomal protein S4
MSRYTGPRVRLLRRFGEVDLPGLTRKRPKRLYPPGQHGPTIRQKKSDYRIRLEEKQKLRYNYGLRERQLVRYMKRASRSRGNTGEALMVMLESRLDNVVFRLGLAPTVPAARQMVNHGHITINGRKVNVASYEIRTGDVIGMRDREKSRKLAELWVESPTLSLPSHLDFDKKALTAKVLDAPARESVPFEIHEQLVVEYYSQRV